MPSSRDINCQLNQSLRSSNRTTSSYSIALAYIDDNTYISALSMNRELPELVNFLELVSRSMSDDRLSTDRPSVRY
jgi:hypothetical protein